MSAIPLTLLQDQTLNFVTNNPGLRPSKIAVALIPHPIKGQRAKVYDALEYLESEWLIYKTNDGCYLAVIQSED